MMISFFLFGSGFLCLAFLFFHLVRKEIARLQSRVGPDQCGFGGFWHTLSDGLKLFQKKSQGSLHFSDFFWWMLVLSLLGLTLPVLPFSLHGVQSASEWSPILIFFITICLCFGSFILGFQEAAFAPSWSATRWGFQVFSGYLPCFISFLTAAIQAQGMGWVSFASVQGFWPWQWGLFLQGFSFFSALVFISGGLMILAIPPFGMGFSTPEVGSGIRGIFSGRLDLFFFLVQFYLFFLWSLFVVSLFLGSWNLSSFLIEFLTTQGWEKSIQFVQMSWVLFKTFLLMLLLGGLSRSYPKGRLDQLVRFSWGVLIPLAMVCLLGTLGLKGLE